MKGESKRGLDFFQPPPNPPLHKEWEFPKTGNFMERVEFAADLETPVSAFLKLTPLEPVFLLESV